MLVWVTDEACVRNIQVSHTFPFVYKISITEANFQNLDAIHDDGEES